MRSGSIAVWLALSSTFVALSGCATHRALSRHTSLANETLADLYFQQIVDNTARFVVNPMTMPSFATVDSGTVNLQDQYGADLRPTYSPTLNYGLQGGGALPILSILFGLGTQRQVTENWSTIPLSDSDNLRRVRCAFQLLVGMDESACDDCQARLEGFFLGTGETLESALPRDWFMVGTKRDVSPDACYVGHSCETYVWVTPENLDGLARFTITVIDLATGEIYAPQRTVLKKYKGDIKPANLLSTEVSYTETDLEALKKGARFGPERQRSQGPRFDRGLFFVPR